MRLTEIEYNDARPIDGYGPGFFRIGGDVHEGHQLLLPSGVTQWAGFDDRQTILDAAGSIDVLLVGTGAEMALVPKAFRELLEEAGIGVEPMATPTACRSYNVLLSEGRRIGAALLVVDGA
ncbi:MAG: Mth938-like domain-containing protein [Pseudomonadota bacterium]